MDFRPREAGGCPPGESMLPRATTAGSRTGGYQFEFRSVGQPAAHGTRHTALDDAAHSDLLVVVTDHEADLPSPGHLRDGPRGAAGGRDLAIGGAAAPRTASVAAAPARGTAAADAALQALISEARQHYENAMAAQRAGDWARYGTEIKALGAVLDRIGAARRP